MIGERGAADGSEIKVNHSVRIGLQESCDLFRRLELALVTLAVVITQRVELETLLFCDHRGGGGVDAAAQENNRLLADHFRSGNLGTFHGVALLVPAD